MALFLPSNERQKEASPLTYSGVEGWESINKVKSYCLSELIRYCGRAIRIYEGGAKRHGFFDSKRLTSFEANAPNVRKHYSEHFINPFVTLLRTTRLAPRSDLEIDAGFRLYLPKC